jgi:2'-5' RNA ligase
VNADEYDRFAVVALAPPEVGQAVERIRGRLPPSGRPILPAHVTMKGTFVDPVDLDRIVERIGACCEEAEPFTLTTGDPRLWRDQGHGLVVLGVQDSPPLTTLHWRMVEELRTLCVTTYSGEGVGRFTPHLTIVQQLPVDQVAAAFALVERLDPRYSFSVNEAALVGRRGGLGWETLTTIPIRPTMNR